MKNYLLGLTIGILITYTYINVNTPYIKCNKMYNNPEDVSECVWILENQ
jgi:hypothetical protein